MADEGDLIRVRRFPMRQYWVGVGFGTCLGGWAVCEWGEFQRPSDVVCELAFVRVQDFGRPERCNEAPGPHSRTVFLTSLGTSTGSTSSIVALGHDYIAFEPEYGVAPEPWHPTTIASSTGETASARLEGYYENEGRTLHWFVLASVERIST